MGFDLNALRAALREHGRVARVVIASVKGSSPRETGAAMLVWPGGQSGTIGGGALEYASAIAAQKAILDQSVSAHLSHHALGPDLGQCCGGSVALLREIFEVADLAWLDGGLSAPHGQNQDFAHPPEDISNPKKTGLAQGVYARPVDGSTQMPLTVWRALDRARAQGIPPDIGLTDGWMIEPLAKPTLSVWVWGAGHVGRAIVGALAPLPGIALTWVDTGPERFPAEVPDNVQIVPAADPALLMGHAPPEAHHLILTYSHALDLALCDAALRKGFASAGVIGSATKWARFSKRLAQAGHTSAQIARIACPIGDPGLGKHPQAIAIGVAAQILSELTREGAHVTGTLTGTGTL